MPDSADNNRLSCCACSEHVRDDFRAGDLLIFWGRQFASRVIELATRGPSHIGIICPVRAHGPLLFESTTLCPEPCVLTGQFVRGVQAQPIGRRIRDYWQEGGRVDRLALSPLWKFSPLETHELRDFLLSCLGDPYDMQGAILSGTRLFKWTALMPYPDLGNFFCSELVAAALMRRGRLAPENPSLYNPASLVRTLRRRGIYGPPQPVCLPPQPPVTSA